MNKPEDATVPAAVGAPLVRPVGRLEPGRAAFEAWAAKKWGREAYRHTSATSGEWEAWRAGRAHLLDTQEPAAWVFEWGAISLPHGDPSRITCMSAHPTKAEALAQGNDCDFNWQVYPAYCVDDSKTPNVRAKPGATVLRCDSA